MNSNVNYGLWVIMMCHRRFFHFNRCTFLMGDVDNGGGYERVRAGGIWEIYILPLNFAVNLKRL